MINFIKSLKPETWLFAFIIFSMLQGMISRYRFEKLELKIRELEIKIRGLKKQ